MQPFFLFDKSALSFHIHGEGIPVFCATKLVLDKIQMTYYKRYRHQLEEVIELSEDINHV